MRVHLTIPLTKEKENYSLHLDGLELQQLHLALTWLYCEDDGTTPAIPMYMKLLPGQHARRHVWLPSNGRVQVTRDGDEGYMLRHADQEDAMKLNTTQVESILECIDALHQIDPSSALPLPQWHVE